MREGFDVPRIIIGAIYTILGYIASVHDISIFSREIWIIFDIVAIIVLIYRYKENPCAGWEPFVVVPLIGIMLIGPFITDFSYFAFSKINMLVGAIILFTSFG